MFRLRSLLSLLIAFTLSAQTISTQRVYSVFRKVTGTSNVVTIRQATTSGRPILVEYVYLQCSGVCTATLTKNGTLSSGSSGAASLVQVDERGVAATATLTFDGTVGSTTTIFSNVSTAAWEKAMNGGVYIPFTSGTPKQFTISLTGSSQDLTIYEWWSEP